MAVKLSPYGMKTCCICDGLTTHAIREGDELLPYCAGCAKAMTIEFPEMIVLLYTPKPKE